MKGKGNWERSPSTAIVENPVISTVIQQDPDALHLVYSSERTQEIRGPMTINHEPEYYKDSLVSSWRSLKTTHMPVIYPDGKISICYKNKQRQLLPTWMNLIATLCRGKRKQQIPLRLEEWSPHWFSDRREARGQLSEACQSLLLDRVLLHSV